MLGYRTVHLGLRTAGKDFLGLVNPALIFLTERPTAIGELFGQRPLLKQAPQVHDRENLTRDGQHSQDAVGNVGNLIGSLDAQNLPDMLHVEGEFLFRDAKGDHLLDFGFGISGFDRCFAGPVSDPEPRRCGSRLPGHPDFETWAAFKAMTMRCPLSSFTTPSR